MAHSPQWSSTCPGERHCRGGPRRAALDLLLTEANRRAARFIPGLEAVRLAGGLARRPAGVTDHITSWQNCYRTTQLLGGTKRFALSNSGHIAAIVSPPGNRHSNCRTADALTPPTAEEWLTHSDMKEGTWWKDWEAWLAERSRAVHTAPPELGSERFKVIGEAPGEYVRET